MQLSLYWENANKVEWYWSGDDAIQVGTLEELETQLKEKSKEHISARLFLPELWFSSFEVIVPTKGRITSQTLKFAAEEFLAQDIDQVHLVSRGKANDNSVAVTATERSRFVTVLKTLSGIGLNITEAFDVRWFRLPDGVTEDVLILIQGEQVTFCANNKLQKVHLKGFSQWFELWVQAHNLPDDANIRVQSDTAEGAVKSLVSELNIGDFSVNWLVQRQSTLSDWHELANQTRLTGNLITNDFSERGSSENLKYWLPLALTACLLGVFWCATTLWDSYRIQQRAEQTWAANESIYRQVFGSSKRIQRPFMVREVRSLIGQGSADESVFGINAIQVIDELNAAAEPMLLEDFRFVRERNEVFFTLIQVEGDAFANFESLKNALVEAGYATEYSANQDGDGFRARFRSSYGVEG